MKLERKFPVSGRYITKFQENMEENLAVTSSAELRQSGRRIYGRTAMSEDSRKWILEGNCLKKVIFMEFTIQKMQLISVQEFFLKDS